VSRRRLQPLLAALAMVAVAIPIPVAAAAESTVSAAPAKRMAKQIKALKRQAATLTGQLAGLEAKAAALEGRQSLPPDSVPPTGSAGGDLQDTYPNPQLRPSTVLSSDIANGTIFGIDISLNTITASNVLDGSIDSADLADGGVGLDDLGPGSVGGPELLGAFIVKSLPNIVGGHASGGNAISCPDGTRVIGGGLEWTGGFVGASFAELFPILSVPSEAEPNVTWEVAGHNNTGETKRLFAKALCLREQ
jgi:hypothetical protein